MMNLFNKKQEKKKALSLDDLRFIATSHPDQNVKDEVGEKLVNENARNKDFYNLQCIMSENNYSIKTQILAGEKYIEHLSSESCSKQKELIKIAGCKEHIKENREKAGIQYIDNRVSNGNYQELAEISKNSDYPLEVRSYAQDNFNSAFENYINERIERIKQGNFTFLLYFGEEDNIPDNLRTKVEESFKRSVEAKLKSGYKDITSNYFFKLSEHDNLSESFKSWAEKQGTEIAREEVNECYSKGNYSALVNYSVCGWSQEVQELSKKKLEELVVEMGKRL